jgi:HAE1 family hydrophobic/amphiphilic exporter-1
MLDIERIRSGLDFPADVTASFTGSGDLMEESFASINFSLFLAIVLIYMILASQFESFVHPLTIMLSLPLSIAGALGGLALTGRTLNIFSMIGMIMLMGLVTKNAILLVDYTRLLRDRGMGKDEAILTAGPVRLRPILMTALSTIAGMIPIAIGLGAGSETRAPMGACVVGGLVTSTMLTLVVVPVMYSLMDDAGRWVLRSMKRSPAGTSGDRDAGGAGGDAGGAGADSSGTPARTAAAGAEAPAREVPAVGAAGDPPAESESDAFDVSEAPPRAR